MEGVEKWGMGASVLPLWSSVSRICQSEEERVGVSGTGRVEYKSGNGHGNVVRYFWKLSKLPGQPWVRLVFGVLGEREVRMVLSFFYECFAWHAWAAVYSPIRTSL